MKASDSQSTHVPMHRAFDALPIAVAIVAGSGEPRINYVNAAFATLTGFPAPQLIGRSPLSLVGSQSDPAIAQQWRTALNQRTAFAGELLAMCRGERVVWLRISMQPFATMDLDSKGLVITFEDITTHKAARASVRASEARLEVAMEASELSMWDWNVTRDEVYYNDHWGISVGIDPKELVRREALHERLMLPDDATVLDQFERHFRGTTSYFECEYELPTAFGKAKWFLARAKVVKRDENGKAERVVGVLRDISRRKQNLHDALNVQQRWERAVHGTSDGLYDWDLLTGHVWYAARFREIVGYTDRDFPDTFSAFQNIIEEADRGRVVGSIRAHLENRTPLDVRCRVTTAGGDLLWCRMRGEAERNAGGRPLRLAGSISDISAQVEAEQALNRTQDFYGTILDSLPLYIAYADRSERVIYANHRFQQFFDIPLMDSRGRSVGEIVGQRRYEVIGTLVRTALQGRTVEQQGRFRDATGRAIDMEAAFVPHRDEAGEIQGCFVAVRDVTEQRLLEAELRQSQKMEAVGRLTGGIAHDFNNLLAVIIGHTQLLSRSLRESPRLLRQAETALKAAMRGGELTRRLLAFARQQVLEPKVVDVNGLIGGMFEFLRRSLTGEIDIRQQLLGKEPECGDGQGARVSRAHGRAEVAGRKDAHEQHENEVWPVKIDPGQLENAVLNLVINARDAMPEGGTITIATRNVVVNDTAVPGRSIGEDAPKPGEYVLLEVTDNGSGMSADTLKRVFEPFFTTKDVGKGSGLGLSMVYGFVKQSDGYINVTSTVGEGTSVHLYFPRTHALAEHASLDQGASSETLPRGDETILVVEDDPEVRGTAVEILGSLGYRLLEAANGHQALEQFMQHPDVALVFSDVMLPGGLLGTSLVTKLCERRAGLKVLMTTGFSESVIMHRGLLDGSIAVLSKPYKVEDLARRVRAILDETEETQRVPA
jgi:PAS domain S-box-containing protein